MKNLPQNIDGYLSPTANLEFATFGHINGRQDCAFSACILMAKRPGVSDIVYSTTAKLPKADEKIARLYSQFESAAIALRLLQRSSLRGSIHTKVQHVSAVLNAKNEDLKEPITNMPAGPLKQLFQDILDIKKSGVVFTTTPAQINALVGFIGGRALEEMKATVRKQDNVLYLPVSPFARGTSLP